MQEPERPLGLGILAVTSFGVALWNIQSAVVLALLMLGKLNLPGAPELAAAYQMLPVWFRGFLLIAAIAKAALLIAAGIAYFGRRRVGRVLGVSYGVLSIAESALAVAVFRDVGRDQLIGILFAVFTIVAVSTMYKPILSR
jgi:hypothetical protein